jgi:integrase
MARSPGPLTRKVGLTDRSLLALKPAPVGKRVTVWDALMPGLAVRVTDKGKRSFYAVRRRAGETSPTWALLGAYPVMKLGEAREAARAALGALVEGKDPTEVAEARRRAEEDRERERRRDLERKEAETFAAAIDAFVADGALAGLRTGPETEAILRRDFLGQVRGEVERDGETAEEWIAGPDPLWSESPVVSIARRDVVVRLDAIKRARGKHAARHAKGAVSKFFSWCVEGERFGLEISPCANVTDKTLGFARDGRELKRKRVLNDEELRDVWHAAEALTANARARALARDAAADVSAVFDPTESLVKLLALTGQRLNDVAMARWAEIDTDRATLTVPPERYKTNVAQEVPLPPTALGVLLALPRFKGFALSTTGGRRPVSGFSKMKARLDGAIAALRAKDGREPMSPWTIHDLRRTVRTRLVSDLGIEAFVAERVIGHALPGLHGVYDQGSHRTQKRDALERWAEALKAIVAPEPEPVPDNVVKLRALA